MLSLRSELRRKLLTFFYVNRAARVYVRQLAQSLQVDSTNMSRELARLASQGLLIAEIEGRQLYYRLNPSYPYLKPLFTLLKGSIGIEPSLRDALERIEGIESAWLYGSFANGDVDAASDIDLLLIGRPLHTQLASELRSAEKLLRREINYTVLTSPELKQRLAKGDALVSDIWNGNRIRLVGNEDHQAAARQSRSGQAVPGRRTQKSSGRPEKSTHRRGNRLPNGLPSHAQGIAGSDVELRTATARAARSPRRNS
jgi:predicted nucleotidyltransferase/predicted transcriptional regulator with HTH domain